jgi:GNAT superfamily N-acetyltransferase
MICSAQGVKIERWRDVPADAKTNAAVDAIFFEASAMQSFPDAVARAAFRERWLGRYLKHFPEWTYVARAPDGLIVGYVIGSPDDPARTPLFDDIGYFREFAALTSRFPAQLHVNLTPAWRGKGVGAALVEAFISNARRAGLAGVHVVTTRGMRNIRFYERIGFREQGALRWNDKELVFLARALGHSGAGTEPAADPQ